MRKLVPCIHKSSISFWCLPPSDSPFAEHSTKTKTHRTTSKDWLRIASDTNISRLFSPFGDKRWRMRRVAMFSRLYFCDGSKATQPLRRQHEGIQKYFPFAQSMEVIGDTLQWCALTLFSGLCVATEPWKFRSTSKLSYPDWLAFIKSDVNWVIIWSASLLSVQGEGFPWKRKNCPIINLGPGLILIGLNYMMHPRTALHSRFIDPLSL